LKQRETSNERRETNKRVTRNLPVPVL
jgi:hypothetical protein